MTKHQTISTEDGNTIVSAECIDCHETKSFTVSTSGYDRWAKGQVIQRALPEVPEDDREILISGQCGKCFDAMFAEDEE